MKIFLILTMFIFILITIGLCFFIKDKNIGMDFETVIVSIVGAASLTAFLAFITFSIITVPYFQNTEKEIKYELVSISDNIDNSFDIQGNSFLTIGNIKGSTKPQYNMSFSYIDNDGYIRPKVLSSNIDKIKFECTEDNEKYIIMKYNEKKAEFSNLAKKLLSEEELQEKANKIIGGDIKEDDINEYIIHLPKENITLESNVDFK